MKTGSIFRIAMIASFAAVLSSCGTVPSAGRTDLSAVPTELTQQTYLHEVVRHLYRWYLDEAEIERLIGNKKMTFWIRGITPELDPGDHSQMGEIFLPQVNIAIRVKKADYRIEEMDVEVKSPGFRITQIVRGSVPGSLRRFCRIIDSDMKEMRDYLFRTRNQQDFPDAVMIERLRQALLKEVAKEGISVAGLPAGDRMIRLAPLSPVANETWVYWEDGRKLFYFASDIDLSNPAVWEHETMMVRVFDLDQQVIVSPSEASGSNRFLTRYQVSRALFNCMVLGRRVSIPAPAEAVMGSAGQ